MILVVGGRAQGKRTFARKVVENAPQALRVAYRCEELVRELDPQAAFELLSGFDIAVLESVGSGIVPACAEEREWRERVGRLGCLLAERADAVVRMMCGIPQVIKGDIALDGVAESRHVGKTPLEVTLVRHGATAGTARRCYSGAGTDEPLSAEGRAELEAAERDCSVRRVVTSGMARADETARILFPNARIEHAFDLREMDFGDFEGKSFRNLEPDARYRAWVEAGCETACPNGEGKDAFTRRASRAFRAACDQAARRGEASVVFVVHAGTIRAILSECADRALDYFAIETKPGGAWAGAWSGFSLGDVRPVRGARLACGGDDGEGSDGGDARKAAKENA